MHHWNYYAINVLLHTSVVINVNCKLTINTFPWHLRNSRTLPRQLSNSLTLLVFFRFSRQVVSLDRTTCTTVQTWRRQVDWLNRCIRNTLFCLRIFVIFTELIVFGIPVPTCRVECVYQRLCRLYKTTHTDRTLQAATQHNLTTY